LYNNKFLSLDQLRPLVEKLKGEGKRVVLANGVFDLLHVGHLRYLQDAKGQGDVLIVALNTDSSAEQLKGKGRPLTSLKERIEILSSLQAVDYITCFAEKKADKVIFLLKPDVQAKGTDYTPENVPERDIVASLGGKIAICGDPKDHSTTEIIRRVKKGS